MTGTLLDCGQLLPQLSAGRKLADWVRHNYATLSCPNKRFMLHFLLCNVQAVPGAGSQHHTKRRREVLQS